MRNNKKKKRNDPPLESENRPQNNADANQKWFKLESHIPSS